MFKNLYTKKSLKIKNFKLQIGIVILFFILYCIPVYLAHSQTLPTGLNLTVSPSVLDLSANPGDTITQKFRVRNNTSSPFSLKLTLDKLSANQQGDIQPVKPSNDPSLAWVTFDSSTVSALPNEWTTITTHVTIPKDAAFGYYYAIHIAQDSSKTQDKSGAKLLGEVVIPMLLNVKSPNAKASLTLVSFSTPTGLAEYLPVSFAVTLKNTGNVHIRPKGNIFIRTGPSDSDVSVLDINQPNGAILPGATRTFRVSWNDGFLVEKPVMEDGVAKLGNDGKPQTQLVVNWDKLTHFRIGKYSATLLAVYDNGTRDVPLQSSTTFWVLPWKALLALVGGLFVLLFVARVWLRWYVAGQIKKHQSA